MIHLYVGRMELDWGKNHGFTDHSALFQPADVTQVPYFYVDDRHPSFVDDAGEFQHTPLIKLQDGLSKPLGQVVDRLKLLGYSLAASEQAYIDYLDDVGLGDHVSFDDFKGAVVTMDVATILDGEKADFSKALLPHLRTHLSARQATGDVVIDDGLLKEVAQSIPPYTALLLLALNPDALCLPVMWAFADLENGGWGVRREFVKALVPTNRVLLVTEGSSDAKIIGHALRLLRPHIADFFDFVDMEEGYPFSGAGNVVKFIKGLISIAIQNDVIVIFDNDAEGAWNHKLVGELNLPTNMMALALPELEGFAAFPTIGPNGRHDADINGCAAAIECYLDLDDQACVQWTSFNKHVNCYQGELLEKTRYMKTFLNQRERQEGYNYQRIEAVLDLIIDCCASMREEIYFRSRDEEIEDERDGEDEADKS